MVAIPAFKKAHFNKVLGENLDKVANKLQGKTLKLPDLPSTKTAYQELEDSRRTRVFPAHGPASAAHRRR